MMRLRKKGTLVTSSHTHAESGFFIDSPLQDVGFSDAFEKVIKVLAVGDETGLVQVASAAITRGMIVLVSTRFLVSQNEPEVKLERVGLFLEHDLQRRL